LELPPPGLALASVHGSDDLRGIMSGCPAATRRVDKDSGALLRNEHVADARLRVLLRRPLGPAARVSPSATIPVIRP